MTEYLLSFEKESDDEILIHGDEKGLLYLQGAIEKLIKNTKEGHFEHEHLMTPDWGGYELSSKGKGGDKIHHVKLYCWKGKQPQ